MIDGDWLFFDKKGFLLDKTQTNTQRIYRVDICWRVQKNGQNNEIISFWRDDIDERWCPVRAAWRICMRVRQLKLPLDEPLARYVDYKTSKIAYMNALELEQHMRAVASAVTGIQEPTLLQKMFGMHSIRVTACNELARLGVNDSFIKRRLRWRSETFQMYLRNNVYTAQRHNLSLNLRVAPQGTLLQQQLRPHTNNGRLPAQ